MKDENKTKRQLINDLVELRKQIYRLAESEIQRKQAEESVERLYHQNELVLNAAGEGIFGLDMQGKHTFVNPAAAQMLGYTVNELIGRHSHTLWHYKKADGSSYPVEKCPVYAAYKDGSVHHKDDEVFWRKDGTYFPVAYTSTPIIENKNIVGAVVTFRDITERKQVEEALQKAHQELEEKVKERSAELSKANEELMAKITAHESTQRELQISETKFRQIFDNMSSGVAVYEALSNGEDFIIRDINKSVEKIEKISKGDIIGKSVLEVFPGVKQFGLFEVFQRVWKTGNPEYFPVRFYKDNRISGWKENYTYKLPSGEVVAIYDDVTDRKKAEEALEEREKELQIEAHNLEEANVALKVLLKRRDEDKAELEDNVLLNMKGLVTPYLEKLKMSGLDKSQKAYMTILEASLNQVTSPFLHRLSFSFSNFTPTEIQVANLLKQGKTNKEIGELLNSSSRTIAFHRDNIRKKLGLKNKKTNLKSYLLSLK
jgi:PAS domain S-box-containing protein